MPHHPTDAQSDASRANGRRSHGPSTEDGKARSSANSFQHGLRGVFTVLPSEDQSAFDSLLAALRSEHQPATPTEALLVEKMAQHDWLSRRAQLLQDAVLTWKTDTPSDRREQTFVVYLRYQTSNDRAFSKCLSDLLKLRAERRKQEVHEAQVRSVNPLKNIAGGRVGRAGCPRPIGNRPPSITPITFLKGGCALSPAKLAKKNLVRGSAATLPYVVYAKAKCIFL